MHSQICEMFIFSDRNLIARQEKAVCRKSAEKKGHEEKRADYKKGCKRGKEWQKREREERTFLPFGVKQGADR